MSSAPSGQFIVDLHSQLVPRVDNGSTSSDDALEGLGRMVERGVRTVLTTPHLDGILTFESEEIASCPNLRHYLNAARNTFKRLGAEGFWELLTQINPGRICRSEDPFPILPVKASCRMVERIRSFSQV